MTETLEMGTHLRVLSESFPMNTSVISFLVLWTKVVSALEGLIGSELKYVYTIYLYTLCRHLLKTGTF